MIHMFSPVKCNRKSHVVIHVQNRHQTVILEYKPDVPPPKNSQFLPVQRRDIMSPYDNLSLRGRVQPADKI